MAVGFPPKVDGRILLLKTLLVIEHEIKLRLRQKPLPYSLVSKVSKGTMHTPYSCGRIACHPKSYSAEVPTGTIMPSHTSISSHSLIRFEAYFTGGNPHLVLGQKPMVGEFIGLSVAAVLLSGQDVTIKLPPK